MLVKNELITLVAQRLKHFDDISVNRQDFIGVTEDAAEKKGFFLRDFGMKQWDWPQGVGIFGLHLQGAQNDDYIKKWAAEEINKGLPTKNINTVCPLLTLMDYPEYEQLALEWMNWIEKDFPRTDENGLQHITSGPDKFTVKENDQQIWVDSIFMTVLFMAKMGVKYDNPKWQDDALYQVLLHVKYLLDRETGLFYHGWNFTEHSNYGGNFWCRGNSWLTLGIPLFLEIMEGKLPEAVMKYLKEIYNCQVETLRKLRAEDGLWHTIITDENCYTETSGSAGIVAGILLGNQKGLLDNPVSQNEATDLVTALEQRITEDGTVTGVSAGTAISPNKEDYKHIIQTPMVYGQAMMLLALTLAQSMKVETVV